MRTVTYAWVRSFGVFASFDSDFQKFVVGEIALIYVGITSRFPHPGDIFHVYFVVVSYYIMSRYVTLRYVM